jgi:hypothetical protein
MNWLLFNILIVGIIYTSNLIHSNLGLFNRYLYHRYYEVSLSRNDSSITMLLVVKLNTEQTITLVDKLIYTFKHAKVITSTTMVFKTIVKYIFNEI